MSNVIDFRNRQPQGIPAGGQFAATNHGEVSGISLGRHAEQPAPQIPEKLLMGAIKNPDTARDLHWQVQMASDYGNPDHYLENFAATVPHLPRGETEELFFMAMDAQDAEAVRSLCETAADRNTELHPGGTVSPDYNPPSSKIEKGYQQGVLETGEKYNGYRDAAHIAKDIRADLKSAIAGNYLPKDLNYSVRIDKFAGGQSIDVTIQGLPDEDRLDREKYDETYRRYDERDEAKELRRRVEEITNAYNRSDIDSQSDYFNVSYYSHVRIEDDRSREFRESEAEKRRLKRQMAKSA